MFFNSLISNKERRTKFQHGTITIILFFFTYIMYII